MKFFSPYIIGRIFVTAFLICLPLVTLAVTSGTVNSGSTSGGSFNTGAPLPSSFAGGNNCNGQPCSVENPLAVSSFCDLLKIVLQALLILGLPVAVIFILLAGLKYITAYGNPKAIGKAHENLKWTIIGTAVFLGAWTIAQIIKATLVSLGVSSFGSC